MNATDHHYDTVVDTDEPQSCWWEVSFLHFRGQCFRAYQVHPLGLQSHMPFIPNLGLWKGERERERERERVCVCVYGMNESSDLHTANGISLANLRATHSYWAICS
jgi:hypothetical protein